MKGISIICESYKKQLNLIAFIKSINLSLRLCSFSYNISERPTIKSQVDN